MQKSFKLLVTFLISLTLGMAVFAQDQVEFKDVLLDGKPAKLNVATGEITWVTLDDKSVETKIDSLNIKPILVTDASVIASNVTNVKDNATSDFFVVEEGETLLDISRKYNVSLAELKKANNLETTLITKGQKLRIKNFDKAIGTISATNSNSEDHDLIIHIVEKGNTLFGLSKRYNLSVKELKSLNNLDSNTIKIGQKLRINDFQSLRDGNKPSVYVVKKGDNLYRIAIENKTTVDAIKKLNGLTSNKIQIGQKLQLN